MRLRKTSWRSAEPERAQPSAAGGGEPPALEQRLQALVESEREQQELLQQLRTERWGAQQKDSDRRIASIEEALARARIEAEKREQLEQKLAQLRIEVVRLTIELDKTEQGAREREQRIEASDPPTDGVRRGRRFRRDRRDKELIACLVCKRTAETAGDEVDGWIVRADAGLCPDCQQQGWQVAVGGGLPFRRSSDRQTSG